MIQHPKAFHLAPLLFGLALFVISQCAYSLGQSSWTTTVPALDVLSAHYNRITETIQFKLVNNSQRAATAYYVAFGLSADKHVNWESGTGEELLDRLLTFQCRYASANFLEGDDSWEGAIKPGDIYVHSGGGLPKYLLRGINPVQAAVVGVVWSDGSIETPEIPGMTTWARTAINRLLDQRKVDAVESTKVVAILNANPEDADILHRLGEAKKSLQSLMDEYRRAQAQESQERTHHDSGFLVSRVLNNLNNFLALPKPEVPFNAYKAVFECQSKRRVALVEAMSPQPER